MANDTIDIQAEPEERIEVALIAKLAPFCTLQILGALTPADEGEVKSEDGDSMISVMVDQVSQDLDFRGPRVPHTYRAQITVRCSQSDDGSVRAFRDECRRVRTMLTALTGDNCVNLGADGFACDAFVIDSTSTTFEGGENPCNVKTYSATVKGRVKPTEA